MGKVLIIAEAGVNHNGDLRIAKKLISAAKEAGADAVKFQTFVAEKGISRHAEKAEYQKKNTPLFESQLEMVRKLELNRRAHEELISCCRENGIMFMSSPFDLDSVKLLEDLGVAVIKVASGEIVNLPLLRAVGSLRRKVILSTGMSDMDETRRAIEVLSSAGTGLENITVLQCVTEYPAPAEDVNLNAMLTMKHELGVRVGFSDHTLGTEVAVAAVALGAVVIEKHLTLDRKMEGPDHKASLEPIGFAELVKQIRNVEAAMGNGIKMPANSELKNKPIARKTIVAACDIKKGERLSEVNMTVKRAGKGISPAEWDSTIGKTALRDFSRDEEIEI
jgi:N,N'-diacetyllegionaminate synthase